jgi:hypothetical protein
MHLIEVGNTMRRARGARTLEEIVSKIGHEVTVGRYQHWEAGENRPQPKLWGPIGKALGLDLTKLYAPAEAPTEQHEELYELLGALTPEQLEEILVMARRHHQANEAVLKQFGGTRTRKQRASKRQPVATRRERAPAN